MAEVDGTVRCDFCHKDEDEVLHLAQVGGRAICDECVDVCIEQQAAKGVIPDLKLLERHFLFETYFLTKNDIRADLSGYEFKSLTDDHQRETFISLVADRIMKDELTKLIADSLSYRQHEILYRVMEETGLAEEQQLRTYVTDKPQPPLEES